MLDEIRKRIRSNYLADETNALTDLINSAALSAETRQAISTRAIHFIKRVRETSDPGIMRSFLAEYGLSTAEGVALMCLAEALLRVPDAETVDDLIQDKIVPHDWGAHLGDSGSILVNASTWALMLTGRMLDDEAEGVVGALRGAVRRLGEPVIRTAVARAMQEIGAQFVLGRDIEEAMENGEPMVAKGFTYSYDMLGEAARTEADARHYHSAYAQAIAAISTRVTSHDIRANPGISVKLSALHPRYEFTQRSLMVPELAARLLQLVKAAQRAQLGCNIDAEESDRLDVSLDIIEAVLSEPGLAGWEGFGVVVQAYSPRAPHIIDWIYTLAKHLDRRIMVRLVKGAYWDTEIKRAQTLGLDGFPVFTRKVSTDVSYISCARKLLAMRDRIYPQFATHNAHTVSSVLEMAGDNHDSFEFQRLHGMGETLHNIVQQEIGTRCRIYAPVGAHQDLLAYLVRRLLENGANSSFVNQIVDHDIKPEQIAQDPFEAVQQLDRIENPLIEQPAELYGPERKNAKGWDITDPVTITQIETARQSFQLPYRWSAAPITQAGGTGEEREILNPADPADIVGHVQDASIDQVQDAISLAVAAQSSWAETPVVKRADILRRASELLEEYAPEFFALATREAGKTLADAEAEVREAVDFLRYYAMEASRAERQGTEPRGLIICISPWNFPLAIFTGQIAAALVTGNTAIAKPAEQTPLIAARAVTLMHEAGIPENVLQLLPGDGETVGQALTSDPRIAGVCFTGSTEVAKIIDRQLANTAAPDAMLIAETGGLNAMIIDSTALSEQAVRDVIASAFRSAGQRCSALRILYVQRDVEERTLEMLFGAMETLNVGDPWQLHTDVGPVIDQKARDALQDYCSHMKARGRLLKQLNIPSKGLFVPPSVIRVSGIEEMTHEVFGPVLQVARFDADKIADVISAINARGYGLTFGLHTRIDRRVQDILTTAHIGNIYVNRNQIGAIVGCQPFGGEGLSGTGPKAGGPHYLPRFRKQAINERPEVKPASKVKLSLLVDELNRLDGAEWMSRPDRISVLRGVLRGKAGDAMASAAALDCGPLDLPGPTGESNRLTLVPRGRILCLGPDPDSLLTQAVQALRTGNVVLAVAINTRDIITPLINAQLPISALDGEVTPEFLKTIPIHGVAYFGKRELLARYRQALSQRQGPIVPLISELHLPAAYTHERAVCIDTTAAGGNATLLARVS